MENLRREQLEKLDRALCACDIDLDDMLREACNDWDSLSELEKRSERGIAIDRYVKILETAHNRLVDMLNDLDEDGFEVLDELEPVDDSDDDEADVT